MYIHDNSDFETQSHIFQHLKMKLCDGPSLSSLVVGGDDERAMVNAVTTAFPESTHVFAQNILSRTAIITLKTIVHVLGK